MDEFIVFQILEKVFVDVPLKRLRYYRKERDGSVVAWVRSIVGFGEWNNFGIFEGRWEDVLLNA